MAQPIIIFGYGSLISTESIRGTVPTAKDIKPAYIKGFRREFNKVDHEGFKSSNLDLAGIPYCAVDVAASENHETVNGVVFEVDEVHFAALKRREDGYKLIAATAYDFKTDQPLGKCFVFSANKRDGSYMFGNPAQERYLEICLNGTKEYGDTFYQKFLATTYNDRKTLKEIL